MPTRQIKTINFFKAYNLYTVRATKLNCGSPKIMSSLRWAERPRN